MERDPLRHMNKELLEKKRSLGFPSLGFVDTLRSGPPGPPGFVDIGARVHRVRSGV